MNATDTAPTIERQIGEHGKLLLRLADWDAEIHGVDGDVARIWNASGGSLPSELQVDSDADGITIRQYDKGLTLVLGRRSRGVRLAIEVPRTSAVSMTSELAPNAPAPIRMATRPMTVKPKAAPNEIIRNQIPSLEILRVTGPCSFEKKK